MRSPIKGLFDRLRPRQYGRRAPLVLINGLAEQAESWYRNRKFWGRYFEVLAPNILAYEGDALPARIATKQPVTVDYLVGQFHTYLTQFVQTLDPEARPCRRSGLHAAALERGLFARPSSQGRTLPPMAQRPAGAVRCRERQTGSGLPSTEQSK